MEQSTETDRELTRHQTPSLLGLAVVLVILLVASVAISGYLAFGLRMPSPLEPAVPAFFFVSCRAALRVGAFFQLLSAIVLGVFTAAVHARLTSLRVRLAAAQTAFVGGIAATVFTAVAALTAWILGQETLGSSIDLIHALHLWLFVAGGVGQVACFGLLIGGVSIATGPAHISPKWLTWFGLALAAIAELSTLGLVLPEAFGLVTITHYLVVMWMIAIGATLSKADVSRVEPALPPMPISLRPLQQT
jgi:hypothetical protein